MGISVSRVGGSAQIKAMKKVAGTLKIDQAQYRELESFSRFSSDLDPVTAATLDRGRKNTRLLVQPQYSPLSVEEQIAVLYCGTHELLREVPIERSPTSNTCCSSGCARPISPKPCARGRSTMRSAPGSRLWQPASRRL